MRVLACAVALVTLSACATTNPGDAASIYYRLPRTDAVVTLGIDVKGCTKPSSSVDDLTVEPSLKVDAIAGARDELLHLSGNDLSSGVTKRSLTISVDDNGVVGSINSTSTDQQTVIVGNLIKIAATIVTFTALDSSKPNDKPVLRCTAETKRNVDRLDRLKREIDLARAQLPTDPNPARVQKQIDALAAQLVYAKTALHRDTKATVKLEKGLRKPTSAGTKLEFDLKPLAELFETAYPYESPPRTIHGITNETKTAFDTTAYYVDLPAANSALSGSSPVEPNTCEQWITLPTSKLVNVILDPTGALVKGAAQTPDKIVSQVVPASQLAENSRLCLSVAFGENRVVGLKFDKFGRTTEFSWTADARLANVTSALAGASADASSIVKTLQGRDLAADKLELDKLKTAQDLKKARDCQELLDAGASKCD